MTNLSNSSSGAEPECGFLCTLAVYFPVLIWPSMILYVMVEATLLKFRSELSGSFFIITISCGLADILYVVYYRFLFGYMFVWFFAQRVKDSVLLATMSNMGSWGLYYAQVFGVLLIALNRHTAMISPFEYQWRWRETVTRRLIFLQWLLPALIVAPMVLPGFRSEFDQNTIAWLSDPVVSEIYWTASVVLECFILAPALLFLYLHSAVAAYKHMKEMQELVTNNGDRTDLKLLCIGALLSLLYINLCLATALYWFGVTNEFALTYQKYVWRFGSDLFTGVNPFFLLAFSSEIRNRFLAMYGCKRENAVRPM